MREMLIVAKGATLGAATKRLCRPVDAGDANPFAVDVVFGEGRMMTVVRAHSNDNITNETIDFAGRSRANDAVLSSR